MDKTMSQGNTTALKSAIVYATKTGHSKKLAEAIAKELHITAQNIKSTPKIDGTEILFIVGGIYGGQSLPELLSYLESLNKDVVKKVALVTSCTSKTTKQNAVRELLSKKGIQVIEDEYVCRGNFLILGLGHPNKYEIEGAVSYARKLV